MLVNVSLQSHFICDLGRMAIDQHHELFHLVLRIGDGDELTMKEFSHQCSRWLNIAAPQVASVECFQALRDGDHLGVFANWHEELLAGCRPREYFVETEGLEEAWCKLLGQLAIHLCISLLMLGLCLFEFILDYLIITNFLLFLGLPKSGQQ